VLTYVLGRLLYLIPTLIGVSFVVFLVLRLTPGDPARLLVPTDATEADVQRVRGELGLTDPIYVQYGRFLGDAVQGNFGKSFRTKRPVTQELASRMPATIQLAVASLAISLAIGISTGVVSSMRQYSLLDHATMILTLLGISVPGFWLGLMLMWAFSVKLGWFPTTGYGTWQHLVLPAVSLGAASTAIIARMTRSSLLEVLRQDYIRTARAKGLRPNRVVLVHALRNAMIPTITIVGLQLGGLLAGAVIVETVFAWPGVGRLLVDAVSNRDYTVVQATTLFFALIFMLTNLLVDVSYAYVDPRIRFR
jgi:ABC-type dipeptide/oligopeptide/nickel transport system permease component